MIFADTHTHLYVRQFDIDRDKVMERSLEAAVKNIYLPNIDHSTIDAMLELHEKYPENTFPMMGLHPGSVKKDFEKELYIVEDWLNKAGEKFVAVGEIGTDLYWDDTFWEQQKEAFIIQTELAKKFDLPIIIHARESFTQTIELLEPLKDEKLRGIFHCFTGTVEEAHQAIEMGFSLGIGGVSTFKKGGLDKVIPDIDLEHLVLETDSPYLSPMPHRGKRNETSYIPIIAQRVADLKEMSIEEVAEKTTQNAINIFGQGYKHL